MRLIIEQIKDYSWFSALNFKRFIDSILIGDVVWWVLKNKITTTICAHMTEIGLAYTIEWECESRWFIGTELYDCSYIWCILVKLPPLRHALSVAFEIFGWNFVETFFGLNVLNMVNFKMAIFLMIIHFDEINSEIICRASSPFGHIVKIARRNQAEAGLGIIHHFSSKLPFVCCGEISNKFDAPSQHTLLQFKQF